MLGSRKPVGSTSPVAGGRVTLAILFAIFAVNFMDRQVVAILVEPIKRDLILSDTEMGCFMASRLQRSTQLPGSRLHGLPSCGSGTDHQLVARAVQSDDCTLRSRDELLAASGSANRIAIGEGGTNPPSHSIISDLYPISRPRPTRQPDRSSPAAGDPGAIATP